MKMNTFDWIVWILIIIGALNWGLVGAFNLDLVDLIFGMVPWLMRTVYILVGVAAIVAIWQVIAKQ